MPKFFCEYCGIYLTHSSPHGRKQHVKGKKHIANKIEYFSRFLVNFQRQLQNGKVLNNTKGQLMLPGMSQISQMMLSNVAPPPAAPLGGIGQMPFEIPPPPPGPEPGSEIPIG